MQMHYLPATTEHIPYICQTYLANMKRLHGVPRSEDTWRQLLADPACRYYIVNHREPVAWFRLEQEKGVLWLGMLQVAPAHQRTGIGRYVLSVFESMARDAGIRTLGIHTTQDNLAARSLYTSAGYTVTEIGPCTTGDGVERVGYTFQKEL